MYMLEGWIGGGVGLARCCIQEMCMCACETKADFLIL